MKPIDQTIAALEEKLRQAKAKRQQIEARKKAVELKQKRSDDTRRKILVGALILNKVERGEWPRERLMKMLEEGLTRDDDRELFGIVPVSVAEHATA